MPISIASSALKNFPYLLSFSTTGQRHRSREIALYAISYKPYMLTRVYSQHCPHVLIKEETRHVDLCPMCNRWGRGRGCSSVIWNLIYQNLLLNQGGCSKRWFIYRHDLRLICIPKTDLRPPLSHQGKMIVLSYLPSMSILSNCLLMDFFLLLFSFKLSLLVYSSHFMYIKKKKKTTLKDWQ